MSGAVPCDVLRRADWRWLLPMRRSRRALCLADGVVAESVAAAGAALAERVDWRTGRDGAVDVGTYDLVVASEVDDATVEAASSALALGGTFVAVLTRGARDARARLRRRYAWAFRGVRTVIPWPSIDDARAWLPLDGDGARYYFLRRPPAARHPARRPWLRLRRSLDLAALAASPHAVIVARRERAEPAPWWTGVSGAADGDWLLLTPGAGVEALALGTTLDRDGRPHAVVKLARTPDSARRMAAGAAMLDRLHAAGLTAARMAPAPLGEERAGDALVATVESAIDGAPLDAVVRPRSLAAWLGELTEWLVTLARATRGEERPDTWQRRLAPSVERFTVACGATVDRTLLDESVALLSGVGPLPTVVEHHDFRPCNVHVLRDGAVAASDWDDARPDGLPGLDLLHGMAALGFVLDDAHRGGRLAESRRRQETGEIGAARRRCVARYVDAVGMTPDAFRAVQAFAWMDRAADDALARPTHRVQPFAALWEVEARLALRSRP